MKKESINDIKKKLKENPIPIRLDEDILDAFIADLDEGAKKSTLIRNIVTKYYLRYKNREMNHDIYIPKDILAVLYDSIDEKKKYHIIEEILRLTREKEDLKDKHDTESLVHSLGRWFHYNQINFELEKTDGKIIITSQHNIHQNFSTITCESIKNALEKKGVNTAYNDNKRNFRIEISKF